ncbi:hypothetical protein [Kutzneria sp. 744]|uniref:hypothetical protein n=1 Tax=Kutzneria sp. (strain 744) TaxID=345341 RepID=UPI001E4167C5
MPGARPAALDSSSPDPVTAAAASVLLGEPTAVHFVELVTRRVGDAQLRAERDTSVLKAQRAELELQRVRDELDANQGAEAKVLQERDAELERLRKRLREQGVKLREARDRADNAMAEAEKVRTEALAEVKPWARSGTGNASGPRRSGRRPGARRTTRR